MRLLEHKHYPSCERFATGFCYDSNLATYGAGEYQVPEYEAMRPMPEVRTLSLTRILTLRSPPRSPSPSPWQGDGRYHPYEPPRPPQPWRLGQTKGGAHPGPGPPLRRTRLDRFHCIDSQIGRCSCIHSLNAFESRDGSCLLSVHVPGSPPSQALGGRRGRERGSATVCRPRGKCQFR